VSEGEEDEEDKEEEDGKRMLFAFESDEEDTARDSGDIVRDALDDAGAAE
jgi:hypothetical protein